MSRIRSANTKPELLLRAALFKQGFRFRLHKKDLPGRPDLVFPKYKTAIFVHGCFWHMHKKCSVGKFPKSRLEYWKPKLLRNVQRDKENLMQLKKAGWHVITIWECEIYSNLDKVVRTCTKTFLAQKHLKN